MTNKVWDYKLLQCMKWPVAHSPNSTWFWLELVGNCCERLKIIMKYTNIQFCERLGHGWQFHPLLLIHSQTSRTPFSGSIFRLDIKTWYSDAIFGRDIRTRYSDSIFGRDIRSILRLDSQTWILNSDKLLHPTHYNGCNYRVATEFTENSSLTFPKLPTKIPLTQATNT